MKHFMYIIFIVVLLHALGALVGSLGCFVGNQPGLSLVFLVMSLVFFLIAKKFEKLWKQIS